MYLNLCNLYAAYRTNCMNIFTQTKGAVGKYTQ